MSAAEDRAEKWARIWRFLHPTLSWALGAGLFIYSTVSGTSPSAEWYSLIGVLIGGPFITLWKGAKKNGQAKP